MPGLGGLGGMMGSRSMKNFGRKKRWK